MATTFQGTAASFRILGTAATPHNLFSIENTAGSTVTVNIRRLNVQLDATAVLVSVMPLVKTSRPAAIPTGGTVLAKCGFDTADTSAANAVDFLLTSTVYPTFPSVDFELGVAPGIILYLTLNDTLTMTDVLTSVYQRTIAQQIPWFFKDYPHPQATKWKIWNI